MKLSEVIHFYIGSYCLVENEETRCRIVCVHERGLVDVEITGIGHERRPTDEIIPLLRPLSSMTEEEAKEFIVITWNIDKAALIELKITPYGIEFCDALTNLHHAASFSEIGAEEFLYLIRNNFDVFSLIESQQAIDITKLNKDEQSF